MAYDVSVLVWFATDKVLEYFPHVLLACKRFAQFHGQLFLVEFLVEDVVVLEVTKTGCG